MAAEYTKNDYNLFYFWAQIDPATAMLACPSNITECSWNRAIYTTIVLGSDARSVLRTFDGPVTQIAKIPWETPAVQRAFIEEKINSEKKIILRKNG